MEIIIKLDNNKRIHSDIIKLSQEWNEVKSKLLWSFRANTIKTLENQIAAIERMIDSPILRVAGDVLDENYSLVSWSISSCSTTLTQGGRASGIFTGLRLTYEVKV